jgi:flagellar biosynthesis regulator FlaF
MTSTAEARGSAHDARVVSELSTPELIDLLEARRAEEERNAPAIRVAGLERKVAKYREHLAAAEQALADELAAQAAEGGAS